MREISQYWPLGLLERQTQRRGLKGMEAFEIEWPGEQPLPDIGAQGGGARLKMGKWRNNDSVSDITSLLH